jgi:hypothetical protein
VRGDCGLKWEAETGGGGGGPAPPVNTCQAESTALGALCRVTAPGRASHTKLTAPSPAWRGMSCLGAHTQRRQRNTRVSPSGGATHQGDIGCPSYSKCTLYARVPCPGTPRRVSATGAAWRGSRQRTGVPLGRVATRLRSNPSSHAHMGRHVRHGGCADCAGEQAARTHVSVLQP